MPGLRRVVITGADALGSELDTFHDSCLFGDALEIPLDLTLKGKERGPVAISKAVGVQVTRCVHATAGIVMRMPNPTGLVLLFDDPVFRARLVQTKCRGDAGHARADDQEFERFREANRLRLLTGVARELVK